MKPRFCDLCGNASYSPRCKACYLKEQRTDDRDSRMMGARFGHPEEGAADGSARLHAATLCYFARRAAEMGCDLPMAGAIILNTPGARP